MVSPSNVPFPHHVLTEGNSSYFLDAEDMMEVARVVSVDRFVTGQMGELFPEQVEVPALRRVLDLGCGAGGWILDVAAAYPRVHAIGIDISPQMVRYARLLATAEGVPNAEFREMDATQHLDFEDGFFDLVNARYINWFMSPSTWPVLLKECRRLLRPGGMVRVTELEGGFSNSFAVERFNSILAQALTQSGRSFSPSGRSLGITPMLRRLLEDAAFQDVHHRAHGLDCSYGFPFFREWAENLLLIVRKGLPFVLSLGVSTQGEMEQLFLEAQRDMNAPTFCSLCYLLSAWGVKPAQPS